MSETQQVDRTSSVRAQMARFRAALPELLGGPLAGRWVVFRDGVQGDHPDRASAHAAAVARYGWKGGEFVIAEVEPERVLALSGVADLLGP